LTWLATKLNEFNLAYLHVMRGDFYNQQTGDVLTPIRANYNGVLISNMGYSKEEANTAIENGDIDAVAFGVPFLANPDLVKRFEIGAALNRARPAHFYSAGAVGYNDYPTL
jgi:N-ethylmaleimide reductase